MASNVPTDAVTGEHMYTLCIVGDVQSVTTSSGFVRELPVQLDAPIVQVSCGADWICFLTASGQLYSFGNNAYGQIAQGHVQSLALPTRVPFVLEKRIVRVSCGAAHGGFIVEEGALFIFGCGSYGRLGTGDTTSHSMPVMVPLYWQEVQQRAAEMTNGQTSTLPGGTIPPPVLSARIQTSQATEDGTGQVRCTDLSCGERHTLVLAAKTTVINGRSTLKHHIIAFGDGMNGRLGLGSEQDQSRGVLLTQFNAGTPSFVPNIAAIAAGGTHSAAISTSGELFTWGNAVDGQLGHDSLESEWIPREVRALRGVSIASVRCGAKHTMVVSRSGVVYTWGRNHHGQLGIASIASATTPSHVHFAADPALAALDPATNTLQMDSTVRVRTIVAKESFNMALDDENRLFVWGDNTLGQLGFLPGVDKRCILTPKQLGYMDIQEPSKPASRGSTLRDHMMEMGTLPREALTQIEASDSFSLLVFKTKSTLGGTSDDNTTGGSSKPLNRLQSMAGISAFFGQALMGEPGPATPPSSTRLGLFHQYSSIRRGAHPTWRLSLTEKLLQNAIPSKENAYYEYMTNYKVYLRQPSPQDQHEFSPVKPMHQRNSVYTPHTPFRDGRPGRSKKMQSVETNPVIPTAEMVRGFDTWLQLHSPRPPKPPKKPPVRCTSAGSFRRTPQQQKPVTPRPATANTTRGRPRTMKDNAIGDSTESRRLKLSELMAQQAPVSPKTSRKHSVIPATTLSVRPFQSFRRHGSG